MIERWQRFGMFATLAIGIGLSSPALATETPSTPPCVSGAESENLDAIRSTLLLLASDYDREAMGYATEAERYREWANAQDMFAAEPSPRRLSVQAFQSRATELDHAAAESRKLAAKYRQLVYAHARAQGC